MLSSIALCGYIAMCFIRSTLITVGHVSSLGLLESYSEHSCSSVSVNTCLHFSWGNGYGGNCWDRGRGRANFLRNCKLFSKVVVPFYIATSLVGNVQCTHIFSTACYCLSVDYRRSSGCEVLISISLSVCNWIWRLRFSFCIL